MFIGPVALSTACKLVAPGVAINGLMSITKTDMYFEMDEEDEDNKKIDPKVGNSGRITVARKVVKLTHCFCIHI